MASASTSKIAAIVARVRRLKPVRVFLHYSSLQGPLLAAGLSYQALFAAFAAVWVGFSIAGFVVRAQPALENAIFEAIGTAVPGLVGSNGAIDRSTLLSAGILGITGAVALVGLILTAIGWLASGRDAVRAMFGVPQLSTNVVLLKLRDLGLAVGFGVTLLISGLIALFSTQALDFVFTIIGVDKHSIIATVAARVVGIIITIAIDFGILVAFYRVLAGLVIPRRELVRGSLIGAVALGVIQVLGTSLIGASKNPLLASFSVIIGLLIWFNLICQVILIASAWISVSMDDDNPAQKRAAVKDVEKAEAG